MRREPDVIVMTSCVCIRVRVLGGREKKERVTRMRRKKEKKKKNLMLPKKMCFGVKLCLLRETALLRVLSERRQPFLPPQIPAPPGPLQPAKTWRSRSKGIRKDGT